MGFPRKCKTKDLARLLGITPQRVGQLVKEGVLKQLARDEYDAAASIQAYIAFCKNAAAAESGRFHGLSKERAAMVRIQRELAQIELDERLGNVVLIDDACQLIKRNLLVVRDKFLSLAGRVAPLVCPDKPAVAQQIIFDAVTEVLTELHALETYNGGRAEEQPPAVLAQ